MRQAIAVIIGVSILIAVPASAGAHGGGPESIVTFGGIVNSLHFIGTAFWLGGIAFWRLAVTPSIRGIGPEASRIIDAITIRFTHLVYWCIGILALTGLLSTWIHVPSGETFTGTTYGIILIVKIVITVGLITCNVILNISSAGRGRQAAASTHAPSAAASHSTRSRRIIVASQVSLVLAFLMMASIAVLVEFDRSLWSVALNFLRLSALTTWIGATAFLSLVFVPSLVGLESATLARITTRVLSRYGTLVSISAIVAVSATVMTMIKNLHSPSDLLTTGYGTVSLLELLTLFIMALVLLKGRVVLSRTNKAGRSSGDIATTNTISRAVGSANANIVLGLAALFLSSLAGILYYPRDSVLSGEIPMATSSISFDLFEPLGYVVAAAVSLALIWYFGVVEGKVPRQEANEEN